MREQLLQLHFKKLRPISYIICFVIILLPVCSKAYSVLTHEALIDANWDKVIVPLLKEKFPIVDSSSLKDAHAYAYGGSVAPDMGYYPSGSKLFTSLVHYVRTGDFIEHLLEEATNVNEYAFALGVLCHYYADKYGHSIGINPSVPLIYPKLKEKYGDTVTWGNDHISHVRTEFSFDVLQTARGVYASTAYQGFVGFKISDSVLERAFYKTYGLHLTDLFKNLSRTISIFRWTVGNLLPFITRTAWSTKKKKIQDSIPGATARSFIYKMKIKNYNKQFDKRERPGFVAYVVAGLIKILPKVGPLRILHFKQPTILSEKKFAQSFDSASIHFVGVAHYLQTNLITLANVDFDTGNKTVAGEYMPSDDAYKDWVLKLSENNFLSADNAMKKSITNFFNHYNPQIKSKQQLKDWNKITAALTLMKSS